MVNLPKSYIRVARDITGYWGTYPPSLELKPAVIGRVLDGMFVKEGLLSQFPGYNPKTHADQEEPERNSVSLWNTRHVSMNVFGVDGSAPAGNASAGIRMQFGAANEAAPLESKCVVSTPVFSSPVAAAERPTQPLPQSQSASRARCMDPIRDLPNRLRCCRR